MKYDSIIKNSLNDYINILSDRLINILKNDNNYISNIINFHAMSGNIEFLIMMIGIDFENEVKYNSIISKYKKHYVNNNLRIDQIVHYELNSLRSEIDEWMENYWWEIDNGIKCDNQEFDDNFLGYRDRYEFIFFSYKKITGSTKQNWIERLDNKMNAIDKDLKIILPILYKYYINNCNFKYLIEPDKPIVFWWRKMHFDLLKP